MDQPTTHILKSEREGALTDMAESLEYGAFKEKFTLQPRLSPLGHHQLPLSGLTFAVKDMSVHVYILKVLLFPTFPHEITLSYYEGQI